MPILMPFSDKLPRKWFLFLRCEVHESLKLKFPPNLLKAESSYNIALNAIYLLENEWMLSVSYKEEQQFYDLLRYQNLSQKV